MYSGIRPASKELLPFGPALGEIMQVAYVVPDIGEAMKRWTGQLGVGPFFHFPKFPLLDAQYRGKPCDFDVDLALAYSGGMCFELIQQNNDAPSVYREIIDRRGYGFHHWAISTRDIDGLIAAYRARGFQLALHGVAAVGARAAYIDTSELLGGMVELIELKPAVEGLFATIRDASVDWDGSEPVRSLEG